MNVDPKVVLALAQVASNSSPALSYQGLKQTFREEMERDPIDATVKLVVGSSFLFYLAERGQNEKIKTIWDALVFCSTCLSVGYASSFAVTTGGKAIATLLMTIGPSMAAALLAPPGGAKPEVDPRVLQGQELIASKLEAILEELKRRG